MRKIILFAIVLAIIGYVAWLFFTTEKLEGRRRGENRVVAVETAKVKITDLADRSIFTGSVRANERFDAAPKINEIIKEIRYDAGDTIRLGDTLAILDDEEYVLAVEQKEASLAVAKANVNDAYSQLEITQRDFERAKRLRDETVISVQEFDKYKSTHQAQQAKYEVAVAEQTLAESALRTAMVKLGQTRIMAAWTGGSDERIVAKRYLDAGSMAKANDPILAIIDITTVKAIVAVNEKDYPKITLGYPVSITTDAFPGRQFKGKVNRIPQELGDLAREAEIEIEVDNHDLALKPGMFIRAEIEFAHRTGTPAAPLEAVVRREDGDRGVFVVDRETNEVVFQPVIEGILDHGWVELVNGGSLLDREVVVMGQHLLKDGSKVIVAEES
jgi:RND family efflux transporter, MFP subunit